MARRILIASANPWAFCMAVERDIVRSNPNAQVDLLNLFTLCSRESPHWRPRDKAIEKFNRKIERFVKPLISGRDITGDLHVPVDVPPLPRNFAALRSYEVDGAKVGMAVLSTVTSLTTMQFPLTLEEFGPVLLPAWRSAHRSLAVGQAVRGLGYDQVVTFNGRHCYSRPFCDVLQETTEVIRYEQASAGDKYIAVAGSVQEPATLARLIEAHQFNAAAGEAFFHERMNRETSSEVGFYTATQRAGQLPQGMKPGETITFFTSSSDEMAAVTDAALYGSFATQHDVAIALAEACKGAGLQLLVRLHPHLRFKNPAWKREWDFAELERCGVRVLQPDDPSDSYSIVRASRAVVTCGSTIGIEAAYLGVANAVVGTWVGGRLGASIEANTIDELVSFMAKPRPLPDARERAMLFGSFYKRAGKPLPELDVGAHPNLARIDGRIVDRVRYPLQKLRFLLSGQSHDPGALDVRSGTQAGRVVLATGTDYGSALQQRSQGNAATSGARKSRRAATENSRSRE